MTARWEFPCDCSWNDYRADCYRPLHVAIALRDVPSPRIPLILSAPCGDFIPAWVLEASL